MKKQLRLFQHSRFGVIRPRGKVGKFYVVEGRKGDTTSFTFIRDQETYDGVIERAKPINLKKYFRKFAKWIAKSQQQEEKKMAKRSNKKAKAGKRGRKRNEETKAQGKTANRSTNTSNKQIRQLEKASQKAAKKMGSLISKMQSVHKDFLSSIG